MTSFTRLLRLIGPYRGWILAGVLFSAATTGASIGLMAVSAYLISRAALTAQLADIAVAITAVRAFAIARAGLRYAERYITHSATFRILTRLRVWFYQSIEPLAPARLQTYHSGDLLARIASDIETLESFYVRVVVPPLAAVLVTALACWILGWFSLWLGGILLIFMLLTGVALPLLNRRLSLGPAKEQIAQRAVLSALMVDEIQGMAELLAFGQEGAHGERIQVVEKQLNRAQEHLAMARGIGNACSALLASLAGLAILALAIPLVTDGQIAGVYLALLPLVAIASFETIQPLSLAVQMLETSQAAARRLFELIDSQPEAHDPAKPSSKPEGFDLQVTDLTFRYPVEGALDTKNPLVFDKFSLHAPAGSHIAIRGPSGSGKSTLVNLLLRFWDYDQGTITIGGQDLHAYRAEDIRALIGVVAQETHLFNVTIGDNLLLANPEASQAERLAACQAAQIHDFIEELPEGYDTLVGENGLLLSGGERQRLAIARAILKSAPIFILDEATSHLDPLTEHRLFQSLEGFMRGRTVLIISHRQASLPPVDQVIELEQGGGKI